MKHRLLILPVMVLIFSAATAQSTNYLQECYRKMVGAVGDKYLSLNYNDVCYHLYSSMKPWQSYPSRSFGTAVQTLGGDGKIGGSSISSGLIQLDSIKRGEKILVNKTEYQGDALLIQRYWDTTLSKVTNDDLAYQPIDNAWISPISLLIICSNKNMDESGESDEKYAVYDTELGVNKVKMFINKSSFLVDKINVVKENDFYGDEPIEFSYQNYSSIGGLSYPTEIYIDRMHGKTRDTTNITGAEIVEKVASILTKPADYKLIDDSKKNQDISVKKYNDHLTFIDLKHDDTRALLVEFKDYCMVIDSPLSSENGEAIIKEVKKIAPDKPIKYFSYGHRCPWALGGFRPFAARDITMLCNSDEDKNFVEYLAKAPRTINPDALDKNPREPKFKMIKDSITIGDGDYEVKAYVIGELSAHTNDFMIYYFPKEKMVWQDHLAWVKKDEPVKKADARQSGLYKAIKEHGLDVETIIQSWPLTEYNVKTIIPFSELEASMNVK